MSSERLRTDTVVVGAGMGGLVSALRTVEDGSDVIVLEKGERAGGSMYLSFGFIWTYDSMEKVEERIPHGNTDLQRLVVERFDEGLSWLAEHGVEMGPITNNMPGVGKKVDPASFVETMVEEIEGRGGDIRLQTPMDELRRDGSGTVAGVTATTPDRKRISIAAENVILATGGFQGNEELVETHITEYTERLWLRSNPWSTGDGLLAAKRAGAKTTIGLDRFYAHNLLAPPASFSQEEFGDVSQYYGPKVVAIDRDGERYTDESESGLEETLAQDTATDAGGRAYYVLDQDLYETPSLSGDPIGSTIERAKEYNGRVAKATTLRELGSALSEWGARGDRAVETIHEFNTAVRNGQGEKLDPPRQDNQYPIDTPPFYAVPVQPGLTFTMGGLAVNDRMQVLGRSSSGSSLASETVENPETLKNPIENLYAVGTDVGNVHHRRYLGGLATALVTGRIAGRDAAETV